MNVLNDATIKKIEFSISGGNSIRSTAEKYGISKGAVTRYAHKLWIRNGCYLEKRKSDNAKLFQMNGLVKKLREEIRNVEY